MIGRGNWALDSEGHIVTSGSVCDFLTTIDDVDGAYGSELARFEGAVLEKVLVLHDGERWDYDAPVVVRFDRGDIAVHCVSCYKMAIGVEPLEDLRKARVLGCDDDPDMGFDSLVGELEWREHEATDAVRGKAVERIYWTADMQRYPISLCFRFADDLHLRVGDFGDQTAPLVGSPMTPGFFELEDDYIVPLLYGKPVEELPFVLKIVESAGEGMKVVMVGGCSEGRIRRVGGAVFPGFTGGYDVECREVHMPGLGRGRILVGVKGLPDDVPDSCIQGRVICRPSPSKAPSGL